MNFAIIGCGRIAPRHAKSLKQLKDARLVAVCDIIPDRADNFAKEHGGKPYYHYQEILNLPEVEVVSICVPSGLHKTIGVDSARAGKHVLVEKPIALTLRDADTLIQACEEAGIILGVVLQNRFNPPMQELKNIVDEGTLGRLLLGNATVRWYRPQEYYQDNWHGTWEMDGGVLLNQAIHHIDALQWLMGDITSVFAYLETLAHQIETPDVGVAVLRFKNGALGTIEASTITYPQNIEGSIAIFGEHGSVKVGGTALNRKIFWKIDGILDLERETLAKEALDPPTVYGFSHRKQIDEMINAIKENRIPSTNGYEARKSLQIVLSIHESVRQGKEVFIESNQPAVQRVQ